MVWYPPGGSNSIAMFGGIGSDKKARNDMWSYRNDDWLEIRQNAPKPSARAYHQMVLNPTDNKLVLFGGDDYSDNKTWLQTLWSWKSRTISDPTVDQPSPRAYHGMAYDPVNKTFIMCGGLSNISGNWTYEKDVWEWPGSSVTYWKRLGKTLAKRRFKHKIAFDHVNKKLILFGGETPPGSFSDSPMKILEDVNGEIFWKDLNPTNMPPKKLSNFAMASDSHFKKVVIFGGYNPDNNGRKLDETWVWDGNTWTKVYTHGQSPMARVGSAMVYDPSKEHFVLFGGETDRGVNNETWIFSLAATRYVDPTSLNSLDRGACADKKRPCKTIKYALSRAHIHDELRVAAGDYSAASENTSGTMSVLHIDKTANITGGWNSDFSQVTGKSRIVGAANMRCIKTDGEVIVYLENFDLSKGNQIAGGGLYSAGGEKGAHVKLKNVTINGNKAKVGGGIYAAFNAKIELNKCQVAANQAEKKGGAIYLDRCQLTLIDSKVEMNDVQDPAEPDYGGGIYMDNGKLVVKRSSINRNKADYGGGIYTNVLETGGSPMDLPQPEVDLENSTLALNEAAGEGAGLYVKFGKVRINSCTIAGNKITEASNARGGGIFNSQGEIKMSNTILATNKSYKGGDCIGKIDTLGFNFIGDIRECQAAWKSNDIHAPSGPVSDPKIGVYEESWGGYPLLQDSPCINKANPAAPGSSPNAVTKKDQRNYLREQYWPPDIGAAEYPKKTKPQLPETGVMQIIIFLGLGLVAAVLGVKLYRFKNK
jgi:predicted outer membrane repeat protein